MSDFEGLVSNPQYSQYIQLSRYSRWLPGEGRRESWGEVVDRLVGFWRERFPQLNGELDVVRQSIYNLEVMPSMRTLMTAGKALERDEMAGFNCSYLAINRQRAFDELMYILLCGTGVGFSCERQYVQQLPEVAEEMYPSDTVIKVADSKIGWASSFRELISLLYSGKIPKWDMSKIRPAGAPLNTFGGRASGPEPLNDLFNYSVNLFRNAVGRRLTSIEVHGLVCKIAEIVVVGGVRRSALISLSNLSDDRMRHAKSGQWWVEHPEYALSNNSVAYTERPDMEVFMREWLSLVESKSGERGIFNREAASKTIPERRKEAGYTEWGCNPCSEIILRDRQVCNLSEVVVRREDTVETLKEKIRVATILGTLQSSLTNFRYLSKKWEENTKEEALLGVSLTGIMDNEIMSGAWNMEELGWILEELRGHAIAVNREWAEKIGVNPSAAITCVKPSGTVSQLVDSASGIHTRHSPYYLRTVRADKKDPLAKYMVDAGFPVEDDVMKPDSTYVFTFPVQSPKGSINREDRTALQQLDLWLLYQRHWCEHKPSVTINVKQDEWMAVGAWVWEHFDEVSGVSFLPYSEHTYQQAPYQEIEEDAYLEWVNRMPTKVDWSLLGMFENTDNTVGVQELSCTGGACEIL
jgi:ribonucleoside-triphosphate reductase